MFIYINMCLAQHKMRNVPSIFVRKPEGKKHLGKCTHRWDYTIKTDIKRDVSCGLD
jgi:hypothetical protein